MANELRKGMWVTTKDGSVGILHSLLDFAKSEVHIVNDNGETMLVVPMNNSDLKQASYMEIPEVRRPPLESARKLGY